MKRTLHLLNFCALFLLCSLTADAQQTATIKGKIVTAEGKPAEGISVKLKGRKLGDATNGKGEYKISNAWPAVQ